MNIKIFCYRYWHKYLLWYLALGLIVLGIVIRPQNAVESAGAALLLCGRVIVPSLLPFFVASSLLVSVGFASVTGSILSPLIRPVFGVSGKAGIAFVLGIISGYPVGAQVVSELYKTGEIDSEEAGRLLAFCNNSGPLFVIGAVGVGMFGSPYVGYILYLAHIISAVAVGIVFGIFARRKDCKKTNTLPPFHEIRMNLRRLNSQKKGAGEIISDAVKNAVVSMVNICGFVVFFTVIGRMLYDYGIFNNIASIITKDAQLQKICTDVLRGMIEMTAPVKDIASSDYIGLGMKVSLSSFMIGFAGVSIHFQTMSVISKTGIKIKLYLAGKLIQGIFAAFTAALLLKLIPDTMTAFLYFDSKVQSETLGVFWENKPNPFAVFTDTAILMLVIAVSAYILGIILKNFKNNNI